MYRLTLSCDADGHQGAMWVPWCQKMHRVQEEHYLPSSMEERHRSTSCKCGRKSHPPRRFGDCHCKYQEDKCHDKQFDQRELGFILERVSGMCLSPRSITTGRCYTV